MLDSAPIGAIRVDGDGCVTFLNAEAKRLAGQVPTEVEVQHAFEASRFVRPGLVARFFDTALDESPARSLHIAEDVDGRVRCLQVDVQQVATPTSTWVAWLRDVTAAHQLRQFRLLAEIGRLRAEKTQTDELARRLVDAILEFLSVDIVVLAIRDRNELRPVAWRGLMLKPGTTLQPGEHVYVRKAIEQLEPVVADGSEWEGGGLAEMTGSHYVVPLVCSGELVGTLHLGSVDSHQLFHIPDLARTSTRFTIDTLDHAFLDALSGYAGAALANVRLFEKNLEERATLQTVVDTIPEGIVVFNSHGEIQTANAEAREIAESDWSNLNTDSRPYRVRGDDGTALSRSDWPFFRAARTGEPIVDEVVVYDFGDRKKHVEVNVCPVPVADPATRTYVGTLRDITLRRKTQRRREEFLSMASHEMRSPLTPLIGFLQMLRKQVEAGEEVDGLLIQRAEQQVSRLSRLIETLLDVTQIETGSMDFRREPVDLCNLVSRLVDIWKAHPRDVDLQVSMPAHPIVVWADPDRLEQVLTNILDNAIKYSDEGGRVDLDVERQSGAVAVKVRDEGPGIPADVLPHVFERFYSGKDRSRQAGSMGLGLYITRQIIQAHDGTIEVRNGSQGGATVTITLPIESH
jgi:signal transduction histidine kinase